MEAESLSGRGYSEGSLGRGRLKNFGEKKASLFCSGGDDDLVRDKEIFLNTHSRLSSANMRRNCMKIGRFPSMRKRKPVDL